MPQSTTGGPTDTAAIDSAPHAAKPESGATSALGLARSESDQLRATFTSPLSTPPRATRNGFRGVVRSPSTFLALQGLAGNRAVAGMLDEKRVTEAVDTDADDTDPLPAPAVEVGSQIGGGAPADPGAGSDDGSSGDGPPASTPGAGSGAGTGAAAGPAGGNPETGLKVAPTVAQVACRPAKSLVGAGRSTQTAPALSIQRTPLDHAVSPPSSSGAPAETRGSPDVIETALSNASHRLHGAQQRASTRLSQWAANASVGADEVMRLNAQVLGNTWNDASAEISLRARLERMMPGIVETQVQQLMRLSGRSFGDTRGLDYSQQDVQREEADRVTAALHGAASVLRSVSLGVPDHVIVLLQPALRQLAATWYGRAESLRTKIPAVQAGIDHAATEMEGAFHQGISGAISELRRVAATVPPSADPVRAAQLIDQASSRLVSAIDRRVDRALSTLDAQVPHSSDYGNLQAECDQALRRFVQGWVTRADELGPEISSELERIRTSIEERIAGAAVHDEMVVQAAQGSFWTGLGVNLVIAVGVTALSGGTLTLPAMVLVGMLTGVGGSVATQVINNVESNILTNTPHHDIFNIDVNEVLASGLVGGLAALGSGVASTATRMAERTTLVRIAGSAAIDSASNAGATAAVDTLRGRAPGEDVAVAGIMGGVSAAVANGAGHSPTSEVPSTAPRAQLPPRASGDTAPQVDLNATTLTDQTPPTAPTPDIANDATAVQQGPPVAPPRPDIANDATAVQQGPPVAPPRPDIANDATAVRPAGGVAPRPGAPSDAHVNGADRMGSPSGQTPRVDGTADGAEGQAGVERAHDPFDRGMREGPRDTLIPGELHAGDLQVPADPGDGFFLLNPHRAAELGISRERTPSARQLGSDWTFERWVGGEGAPAGQRSINRSRLYLNRRTGERGLFKNSATERTAQTVAEASGMEQGGGARRSAASESSLRQFGIETPEIALVVNELGQTGSFQRYIRDDMVEAGHHLAQAGIHSVPEWQSLARYDLDAADYVIGSMDRHAGNFFVRGAHPGSGAARGIRAIDNDMSFPPSQDRFSPGVGTEEQLAPWQRPMPPRVSQNLSARLHASLETEIALRTEMREWARPVEVDGFIARLRQVVSAIDSGQIAVALGEGAARSPTAIDEPTAFAP